jgi:hypothetical protein
VDLEKAYDMVPRKLLWPEIRGMGIPQEIIIVIQKMYENNEAHVKVGNKVSTIFRTTKGVKEECGVSPSLFKIYLQSVLYNWNKKCRNMGLAVGDQTIQCYLFVGDEVTIAQDKEDAEYMTKINRRISQMGFECKYS